MGHACELETSYMLHLQPDLCHMERVVDEIDFIATPSYYMDWIEGARSSLIRPGMTIQKPALMALAARAPPRKVEFGWKSAVEEKLAMWTKSMNNIKDVRLGEKWAMDYGARAGNL